MQLHVELAPPDLVDRRLRAQRRRPRVRRVTVSRVKSWYASARIHASTTRWRRCAGEPFAAVELEQPIGGGHEAARRAEREAALGAGGGHRHRPALVDLAEHHPARQRVVGEEGVLEEHLGEALVAVEAAEARAPSRRACRAARAGSSGPCAAPTPGRCGTARTGACRRRRASSTSSARRAPSRRRRAGPCCARRPGRCRRSAPTSPGTRGRRPAAMRGRMWSCCSVVPYSNTVGASRKIPFCVTRCGPPAR